MTEEEAKTQPCPMSFLPGERGTMNVNNHRFAMRCIGSACGMAWRWTHPGFDHDKAGQPIEPQPAEGYCGLAGKP